jgi:hypothetical protein
MPVDQELELDLDVTEFAYYRFKSPKAKEAINKLRYLLILQMHRSVNE